MSVVADGASQRRRALCVGSACMALGFDTVSNLPSDDPRTGLVLRVDKHTSDGDTTYAHADGYGAKVWRG